MKTKMFNSLRIQTFHILTNILHLRLYFLKLDSPKGP